MNFFVNKCENIISSKRSVKSADLFTGFIRKLFLLSIHLQEALYSVFLRDELS